MTHFSPPGFRKRKGSPGTDELLFDVLSKVYPLTLAELQRELYRAHKLKVSYQGIRKAVLSLTGEGILERGDKGFQISRSWLLHSKAYLDQILQRYRSPRKGTLEMSNSIHTFHASSLYEADLLWADIDFELIQREPKGVLLSINHYPWWLPLNLGHESELWHAIQKRGWRVKMVFTQNTPSTRWAVAIYKQLGVSSCISTNVQIEDDCYYNVVGSKVVRVQIPATTHRTVKKLFGPSVEVADLHMQKISQLGHARADIELSVMTSVPLGQSLSAQLKMKAN